MALDVGPLEIFCSQPVAVWLTLVGTVRKAGAKPLVVKKSAGFIRIFGWVLGLLMSF